jgi:hypothetical protein
VLTEAASILAMLVPDATFWSRFLALTATGPDLLGAVCQHMSGIDRKALHSVDRAMRVAMKATVTGISCSPHTLPIHRKLHEVFPNLSSMAVCIVKPDGQSLMVEEWRVYLQQLASSSELLLNRLRHLSLEIQPANMTEAAAIQAILELLTKWARSVS